MSGSSTKPVVLVTGASSGIGQASAGHLARRGYRVFGGARRPEAIDRAGGVEALLRLDVTDAGSVAAAVEAVLGAAGRIDALVNNAGGSVLGAVEETSVEQAEALFDLNVLGVLRMSQAVLPAMRRQRHGRIVNVSSVVGFLPAPYMGVYAATKHALEGLSESMDHEVRGFGVRVVLVEPGFTRTNIDAASAQAGRIADYAAQRERVVANIGAQIAAAPDAAGVAAIVARAIEAPRFARMPVGGQARMLGRLRRLMPARLMDGALRKTFRLDA